MSTTEKGLDEIVCSFAPSQSDVVRSLAQVSRGTGPTVAVVASALNLNVVTHSSGARILTGNGRYIAGTLGTVITSPVVLKVTVVVGAAVTVVEVACAPINHPEAVERVKVAAREFHRRSVEVAESTAAAGKPLVVEVKKSVVSMGQGAFDYALRTSEAVTGAARAATR